MYKYKTSSVIIKVKTINMLSLIVFLLMSIVGCSRPGSDKNILTSDNGEIQSGIFVDGPVQGLEYQTETLSGTTDENGMFYYREGEDIQFKIGDINLGETEAGPMITPIDMVPGAQDETDPTVTNILCFLQTFDQDNNPQNGICITNDVIDMCYGRRIEFNVSPADFSNSPDMRSLMNQCGYTSMMMVSTDDARGHMQNTLTWATKIVSDEITKYMETEGITDPQSVYDFMEQNKMLDAQNVTDYMNRYDLVDTQDLIDNIDQTVINDNPQPMIDFMNQNKMIDNDRMIEYMDDNGIMTQEEMAAMMKNQDNMPGYGNMCPQNRMPDSPNVMENMDQDDLVDPQDQTVINDDPQSTLDSMNQDNLTDNDGMMENMNDNDMMPQEETEGMMNNQNDVTGHSSLCPLNQNNMTQEEMADMMNSQDDVTGHSSLCLLNQNNMTQEEMADMMNY